MPVSGCVLSTMPGSRGFLSVDRRSSGSPAACPGCWGVLRAFKMYAPNMMAVQAWQFSVKLQLAATAHPPNWTSLLVVDPLRS